MTYREFWIKERIRNRTIKHYRTWNENSITCLLSSIYFYYVDTIESWTIISNTINIFLNSPFKDLILICKKSIWNKANCWLSTKHAYCWISIHISILHIFTQKSIISDQYDRVPIFNFPIILRFAKSLMFIAIRFTIEDEMYDINWNWIKRS